MLRRNCGLILLAFVSLLSIGAISLIQADRQTIRGWGYVIDPENNCSIHERQGKLMILVPAGHRNLNPTRLFNNLLAPRVLETVEGDFILQVQVLPFALPEANTSANGRNSYIGAGLVIWQDDQNFIRFVRAANGETKRLFVSAEYYQDGQFIGGHDVAEEDEITFLRIERFADRFSCSFSSDGRNWTRLRTPQIRLNDELEVGVAALNSTTKIIMTEFQEFKLLSGSSI